MFKTKCPHCDQNFECTEEMNGSDAECSSCNKIFKVKKINASTDSDKNSEFDTALNGQAKSKYEARELDLEVDVSKKVKIAGKLFAPMVLLAIVAFVMIGYLAVPFAKEKAVWYQTAREREAALTEKMKVIEKAKLDWLAKIEKDIETSQNKLAALQVSMNGLAEKEKQCGMYAAQISEYEKSIKGLPQKYKESEEIEKAKLTASLSLLEAEKASMEKEIKERQDKLVTIKTKLQDDDSELQKKLNETDSVRKKLAQLQQESGQASDLINTGKVQKEQLEKLSITLQTLARNISSTNVDYQKLVDDQKQAIAKLDQLRSDTQVEIDKTAKKQAEFAVLNSQFSLLKDEQKKVSSETDMSKRQLQLLQQTEEATKSSINSLDLEQKKKSLSIDATNKQLQFLQKNEDGVRANIKSLEEEKTKLTGDIKQLQAELKRTEINAKKVENK